jgi:hypothetical protein
MERSERNEIRRKALSGLVTSLGHGGATKVAMRIGVEPSYIACLLKKPETKNGKRNYGRNIGEHIFELLRNAYPTWDWFPVNQGCPQFDFTPEEVRLIVNFRECSEKAKQVVQAVCEEFSQQSCRANQATS